MMDFKIDNYEMQGGLIKDSPIGLMIRHERGELSDSEYIDKMEKFMPGVFQNTTHLVPNEQTQKEEKSMTVYERFVQFLKDSGLEHEVEENPFESEPDIAYSVEVSRGYVSPYGCCCVWYFDKNGNLKFIESE